MNIMKRCTRFLGIFLLAVSLLVVLPRQVSALESGEYQGISWSISGRTLTLGGTGAVPGGGNTPWYSSRKNIDNVTIRSGVTGINANAFHEWSSLKSVSIPGTAAYIGAHAFDNCNSLRTVSMGSGIATIYNCAFYSCDSLENVTIPDTVTTIEYSAFAGCTNLRSVRLPSGLTAMGNSAFFNCTSLYSVDVPASLKLLPTSAFGDCSGLKKVTLHEGLEKLDTRAFDSCTGLAEIRLPNSVTEIGQYAFQSCAGLKTVSFGSGLIRIGQNAFQYCKVLDNVRLPQKLTTLESNAFSYCDELQSITLPESLTVLKSNVFQFCPKLRSIRIPSGIKEIPQLTFYKCFSLSSVTLPQDIGLIDGSAFAYCESLQSIRLPDAVQEIGSSAFASCTGLTSIVLPANLTSVGQGAFSDCTRLQTVVFPEYLNSIGSTAFSDCTALREAILPENLTTLGGGSFRNCTALQKVVVPGSVRFLYDNTFLNCSALQRAELSDGIEKIQQSVFNGCSSLSRIVIPASVQYINHNALNGIPRVDFMGSRPELNSSAFGSSGKNYAVTCYYPAGDTTWNGIETKYFANNNMRWRTMGTTLMFMNETRSIRAGSGAEVLAHRVPESSSDQIRYKIGNTSIATVDEYGYVTALRPGNTWLTATTPSGLSAKCLIKVLSVPVDTIISPYEEKRVQAGSSFYYTPEIYPENASNKTLTYRTGNTKIARVDKSGKVTGVAVGNTWLYATTHNGLQAKCLVRVTPASVTSVTYPYNNKLVKVGTTALIRPTVNPSYASNKTLTFRTGNTRIATVDSNGYIRGIRVGNTWLYATSNNGKQLKVLVQVLPNATSISVPGEKRITQGSTVNVGAKLLPSNAYPDKLTYSVGNTRIATVDSRGNVRAIAPGNTWLTVRSAGGKTAKCLIRVTASVPVTSVTYPYTSKSVTVGTTGLFRPTVHPSNATNKTLRFSVGNTSIATVDSSGNIRGLRVGNTWLYATSNNGKQVKVLLRIIPR